MSGPRRWVRFIDPQREFDAAQTLALAEASINTEGEYVRGLAGRIEWLKDELEKARALAAERDEAVQAQINLEEERESLLEDIRDLKARNEKPDALVKELQANLDL